MKQRKKPRRRGNPSPKGTTNGAKDEKAKPLMASGKGSVCENNTRGANAIATEANCEGREEVNNNVEKGEHISKLISDRSLGRALAFTQELDGSQPNTAEDRAHAENRALARSLPASAGVRD